MAHNLRSIRARAAFLPAKHPYWVPVAPGIALGLYVGKRKHSWKVRAENPGEGPRHIFRELGKVEPEAGGLDYSTAVRQAVELGEDIRRGAVADRVHAANTATVADACCIWLSTKERKHGRRASGHTRTNWTNTTKRIRAFFGDDTLIDRITQKDVMAYATRPLERMRGGQAERAADGVNREIAAVLGILNCRAAQDDYTGRTRWTAAEKIAADEVALQHADEEDFGSSAMTLAEVRSLIAQIDDKAVADFARAMFLTCQRVQSLRMADVGDFDLVGRRLRLRFGKNAARASKRRRGALVIPLFGGAVDLFEDLVRGRGKSEPLLPAADGGRLPQDFARYPIRQAAAAAGVGDVTLYDLRHAALTHFLSVEGIDALTIALMADVDPTIIRDRYLKHGTALPDGPSLDSATVRDLQVVR